VKISYITLVVAVGGPDPCKARTPARYNVIKISQCSTVVLNAYTVVRAIG